MPQIVVGDGLAKYESEAAYLERLGLLEDSELSIVRWFADAGPDAIRMRYARALRDLEAAGLIQSWRKWGTKISHLKLTAAGERVASELLSEQMKESATT
jgi:DNA-binding transcriptional regulator YhcF (GntR family)